MKKRKKYEKVVEGNLVVFPLLALFILSVFGMGYIYGKYGSIGEIVGWDTIILIISGIIFFIGSIAYFIFLQIALEEREVYWREID